MSEVDVKEIANKPISSFHGSAIELAIECQNNIQNNSELAPYFELHKNVNYSAYSPHIDHITGKELSATTENLRPGKLIGAANALINTYVAYRTQNAEMYDVASDIVGKSPDAQLEILQKKADTFAAELPPYKQASAQAIVEAIFTDVDMSLAAALQASNVAVTPKSKNTMAQGAA